jgi:hypothetical protein
MPSFARNNQVDFSEEGWAYRVGQADLRHRQRHAAGQSAVRLGPIHVDRLAEIRRPTDVGQ